MATSTVIRDNITAAANALSVWSEAAESDNARDLEAGIARTTAVHAVIMPIYQEQEQVHLEQESGSYKMENFHAYLKGQFRGKGLDFTYTIPELQSIIDWELHDDDTQATFVLWTVEDAKSRRAKVGRDVKVKAANFANYQEWLATTKVRVLDGATKKFIVVDRWTPTGKETTKAKAERQRREAERDAQRAKVLTASSWKKLVEGLEGKNLVTEALKLQHDITAYLDSLKSTMLADDEQKAEWTAGVKAYNAAKSTK